MKNEAFLELHVDGASEMSAECLAQSIYNMAALTQRIALSENPDAFVKINVIALKDGCFQIDFKAIIEAAAPMFMSSMPQIIDFANNVMSLVMQSFELRKHLKGEAPAKIQKEENGHSTVFNVTGDVYYFSGDAANNLADAKINESINKIADAIKKNNQNGGFRLKSSGEESIFENSDLEHLMSAPVIEDITTRVITQKVILTIRTPDMLGSSPWGFFLENKNIKAYVKDQVWLDKLHGHQISISSGDRITAKLKAEIVLNADGTTDSKQITYTVTEVIGDIIPATNAPEQCEL